MKFTLTKEKAKDLKEQLELSGEGCSNCPELQIAENTNSFEEALQSALTKPTKPEVMDVHTLH